MAYNGNLQSVPGLTASADLSAHQFKFMTIGATGAALNTTSGGAVDGVLQDKPGALGEACEVAYAGVSKVEAGAAVSAGALVMSDAAGLAIAHTTTNHAVGRAITAAGASGELISVLLISYGEVT